MIPSMKKLLLMGASGVDHLEYLSFTAPLAEKYADKHGFDFEVVDEHRWNKMAEGRPSAWSKIVALIENLQQYELLFWLDCDAIIVDDSADIALELSANKSIGLVSHKCSDGDVPNTGVMLIRRNDEIEQLLHQAWRQELLIDHIWWEQAAIIQLLGWSLSGHCEKVRCTDFSHLLQFLPNEWNCHMGSQSMAKARIHHWTPGLPKWRKNGLAADYKSAVDRT